MDRDAARIAGFEAEGAPTVRSRVGKGHNSPYNAEHRALATVWLAEKDQARADAELARNEASQADSLRIARSAKNAAWAAAIAAMIAVPIAIVSIVISVLSLRAD